MAYPLTFIAFDWADLPSEETPLDKEGLQEAERRLAKFAAEFEIHWRKPVTKVGELYKAPEVEKGDVALVEEVHEVWYYTGTEWSPILDALRFWKEPVAKEAALPVVNNVVGDIRLDIETFQLYICFNTTGTVVEQWKLFKPTVHTHIMETLTWSVAEALTTEPELIPGGFRRLATEEVQELFEVESLLRKGKAELEIKINGTAVKFEGGSTKLKVGEAATPLALEERHVLSSKDKIELFVHSVEEEPEGLS